MVRPPYVACLRLVNIAIEYWVAIDGSTPGCDPLTLPPDRFFNHIQWWAMQRVKDADRFLVDLERPLPQMPGAPAVVTQADLDKDAESFVAFAKAFGVTPPRPRSPNGSNAVVTSAPAS